MTEHRVSSRYAHALLDIASTEGLLDSVYADLDKILDLVRQSKQLRILFASPVIQYWRKKKIFTEIFGDLLGPLTMNFLLLLTEKRRENLIPDISAEFIMQYNKLKNLVPVEISTAVEIPDEIRDKVVTHYETMTGKKVLPKFFIDPSIKGGIMVRIEDWVYDASIKSQLDQLYKRLIQGA